MVTLVALEHKSAFRSIEAVAEEKQKLVEALPAHGLAVLNYNDARVVSMSSRTKARTVTFGKTGGDDVVSDARCERPEALSLTITHDRQAFEPPRLSLDRTSVYPWRPLSLAPISSGLRPPSLRLELPASRRCLRDVRYIALKTGR